MARIPVIRWQGRTTSSPGYYTRQQGLQPDVGELIFRRDAFQEIDIAPPAVQVAPLWDGAFEAPWHPELLDKLPPVTATGGGRFPKEDDEPDSKRLSLAGTLVFDSPEPFGAKTERPPKRIYEAIYLHPAGAREIIGEISRKDRTEKLHGEIAVTITDVRHFFSSLGWLYGDVNVRMPGGEYDEHTIRHWPGPRRYEPLSLLDALVWIAAHLPGYPKVVQAPRRLLDHKVKAPTIRARGELTALWLRKILDEYRLEFGLTGANEIVFSDRVGQTHVIGEFLDVSGGARLFPAGMPSVTALEQTQWDTVPDVVHVMGKPLYQNIRRRAIAVLPDLDNRIRPAVEVLAEWRYPLEQALANLQVNRDRGFEDVPILAGGITDSPWSRFIRTEKIKRLREHFGRLFQIESEIGQDGRGFRNPDLPMLDRVVRTDGAPESAQLRAAALGLPVPGSSEVSVTGDHPVGFEPPLVIGWYTTQERNEDRQVIVTAIGELVREIDLLISDIVNDLLAATREGPAYISHRIEFAKKVVVAAQAFNRKLSAFELTLQDGTTALQEKIEEAQLYANPDETSLESVSESALKIREAFQKFYFGEMQKEANELAALKASLLANLEEAQNKDWWKNPTLQLWFNRYGALPPNSYTIDAKTGLIRTQTPAAKTDRFFDLLPENLRAYPVHSRTRGAGGAQEDTGLVEAPVMPHLQVVYGIQHNRGSWRDRVIVPVVRDGPNEVKAGKPLETAGVSGALVPEPNMQLYLDREGRPFNLREVLDASEDAARDILLAPRYERAYHYELAGWWPIDAIGPQTSVTHALQQAQGQALQPVTIVEVNARYGGGRGGRSPALKAKLGIGQLMIPTWRGDAWTEGGGPTDPPGGGL